MVANRILNVVLTALAWIVVPLQLVTTFVIGLLVTLTLGLLLIPISLVWMVLIGPLLAFSWMSQHSSLVRNVLGFLFLPLAVVAYVFVCLMPSMGELESRGVKLLLCNTWPYTWQFWLFTRGKVDVIASNSRTADELLEVLARTTRGDVLCQRVVMKLADQAELECKV